jgi:hypothetical protein
MMAINFSVTTVSDETRISFVNVETKGQSKQGMQTFSPNKPKKVK